ncbi:MAG: hypothetical protein JSR82_23740 [Verrucomicrobia bacterium]|nr:hypothetical protein [Verrucomicrobiota bacterium]
MKRNRPPTAAETREQARLEAAQDSLDRALHALDRQRATRLIGTMTGSEEPVTFRGHRAEQAGRAFDVRAHDTLLEVKPL